MENSRTYVGQRYVPKIIGEWNQSETYEGLSIVTNEGNSYTSKKRVPIGIDISNEEYWVVTGNYNAQIENYREDVKQNNEELKKYQQDTNLKLEQMAIQLTQENIEDVLSRTDKVTVLVSQPINIIKDMTISPNFTLEFSQKGELVVDSTAELTLDCFVRATPKKIFSGQGNLKGNPINNYAYAEWFGTDGVDDTNAFNKALSVFMSVKLVNRFYYITTVNIPANKGIFSDRLESYAQPKMIHLNTATDDAIKMMDGYNGSFVENFSIRGGKEGLWALRVHRPHSRVLNISCIDYKGHGLDLGNTNTGSWNSKVEDYSFIGYVDPITKKSPVTTSQLALRVDPNGGNISVKRSNIQIATTGALIESSEQLSLLDINISENNKTFFPNVSGDCSSIVVNGGHAINISDFYLENMDNGVIVNKVDGLKLANFVANNLSRATSVISLKTANTKDVVIVNPTITALNSASYAVNLYNGPVGVKIINPNFTKVKIANNINSEYIIEKNNEKIGGLNYGGRSKVSKWSDLTLENTYLPTSSDISQQVITTSGSASDSSLTFVLPNTLFDGSKLTFVKLDSQRSGILKVQPVSIEKIFPTTKNINGSGLSLLAGEIGSITFERLAGAWYITSKVGNWTE